MWLEDEPSQDRLPITPIIRDPGSLAAGGAQPKSLDPNVKDKAMRCRQLLICFGVPRRESWSSCCPRVGEAISPGDGWRHVRHLGPGWVMSVSCGGWPFAI